MDNTNKPNIRGYIGASGSGKGVSEREYLKALKPKRFMAWDMLNEYGQFCKVRTGDLAVVAREAAKANFGISYWPGTDSSKWGERFDIFCSIVFSAGDVDALVAELADVTSASHARQPWSRLTRQGRHRAVRLIADTQRPAKVDKDFLGSATYLRCFTLRYPDDQRAMAAVLGVPTAQVAGLTTIQGDKATVIRYIERDFSAGAAKEGQIRLLRR